MRHRAIGCTLLLLLAACSFAQTGPDGHPLDQTPRDLKDLGWSTLAFLHDDWPGSNETPYSKPLDSVSKFDLMAPHRARREYEKGLQFLYRKDFNGAVTHLEKAVSIFPKYVSAHNALGAAYMNLGRNEPARTEFQTAVSLDDHLPYSYRNLSRAALALGDYPSSIQALERASSLSPLDWKLRMLLAYVQLMKQDYPAVIATAQLVHEGRHEQAAAVHYLAAAAWQMQHKLPEAQSELRVFLQEEPDSANADRVRQIITQMEDEKNHPVTPQVALSFEASEPRTTPGALPAPAQQVLREFELQRQVATAECETCSATTSTEPIGHDATGSSTPAKHPARNKSPWTLHATVDEVGVFFAATDQGKAVSNLQAGEVQIRDDSKLPAAVLGFRNESQLPLRLGLVIDTSASIARRFSFERSAATEFLQRVVTDKDDLVFVIGFANTVLLVQDFTADQQQISSGIEKLAPAGGTALWDAVMFAADKLASKPEQTPVAKILVVVSDGEDNSSDATLKEALESATRDDVTIYTVSTREYDGEASATIGDRALKVLARQTGGAAFFPGSLGHLNHSLNDLQQVIRGRYLISYKPAEFALDGRYRSIEIAAQKSGHKLRVYARKGYYARPSASSVN